MLIKLIIKVNVNVVGNNREKKASKPPHMTDHHT